MTLMMFHCLNRDWYDCELLLRFGCLFEYYMKMIINQNKINQLINTQHVINALIGFVFMVVIIKVITQLYMMDQNLIVHVVCVLFLIFGSLAAQCHQQ